MSYYEICDNILKNGWTSKWEPENMVPYAYKQNQWVGYDTVESIALKVFYFTCLILFRLL